ncbi:hypothetical protein CYMTET_7185 [Cymbomonas tetramitiformis]|uniref:Uncharacterized protein n=1 Tax=Cymbomonas tetramitiformis TaxID=36881 RepID=A0AAE0GW00_9CHLO|nr:hypothetical protein CYMTET_7185 [Cymbomonas tetramitiformis]
MNWANAAKATWIVELLKDGMSDGAFSPSSMVEGAVVEATLAPLYRQRAEFVTDLCGALEGCVEVLVTDFGFELPEIPQVSVNTRSRGSGKRSREEEDGENEKEKNAQRKEDLIEEEADVDESIFGEVVEEQAKKKQAGGRAGVQPAELATDRELKARMDSFLKQALPGYKASAEKDVYDFDAEVREDYAAGRVKSWCPIELGHRFQYQFVPMLSSGGEGSHQKNGKISEKEKKGTEPEEEPGEGMAEPKERKVESPVRKVRRSWSANFLSLFTVVGVSLVSYGIEEADHLKYMENVQEVGAVVSPLTMLAERWAQAAWGLPGAEEVVRGVATGFSWEQAEPDSFFTVYKYVPPESMAKVAKKLQQGGGGCRQDDTEADCQRGFEYLLELVEYLGFEVAPEKVEGPRQDIVFLGVRLQSNQSGLGVVSMSIDENRVGVLNRRPVVRDFFAVDAAGEEVVNGGWWFLQW